MWDHDTEECEDVDLQEEIQTHPESDLDRATIGEELPCKEEGVQDEETLGCSQDPSLGPWLDPSEEIQQT